MIIAFGFAFLSFVATRDRIIDGRAETLPGPQWTARRGVQRYEPEDGRSESAMVYVVEIPVWCKGRRGADDDALIETVTTEAIVHLVWIRDSTHVMTNRR